MTLSPVRGSDDRLMGAAVLPELTDRRRTEAPLAAARAAREVLAARDRIASDLHDGVIRATFSIGMRLQAPGSGWT